MSRSITDRRVRKILATMDRAAASPHAKEIFVEVAGQIVTMGAVCGALDGVDGWSAAGARALVLAYAQNAPRVWLADMVATAEKQFEWIEWWDRKGHDDARQPVSAHQYEQAAT